MITLPELCNGLAELKIEPDVPIIAHASLSAFGRVEGGAQSVVEALLSCFHTVIMPAFTYRTMLIPECGPADNGMEYGSGRDANRMAVFYHPDLPADRLMGVISETLRRQPGARRSMHPILSFTGINADHILSAQTIAEPLAPIRILAENQGWVLLLGVNHTVNTSIHFAEGLSGRKAFTRWALTENGARECPNFPGCSDGFQAILPYIIDQSRARPIGQAWVQALSLQHLIAAVQSAIAADPLALLCARPDCPRCNAIRACQQP